MNETPTAQQLNQILTDDNAKADDKGWAIYRYLKANIGDSLPSEQARGLLLAYMRLPLQGPSLLHSLILGMAIKCAEAYADFKLLAFLSMWGIGNLRPADYAEGKAEGGRTFQSLANRLAIAVRRYQVAHHAEAPDADTEQVVASQAEQAGLLPICNMVAVKTFESEVRGRKTRMVKLIATDGEELTADWHIFHAKPWQIAGRMYAVLSRRSSAGNVRVDAAAPAVQPVDEAFGRVIGYVDSYDATHKHYHIFDPESRHFVAENPSVRIDAGGFVWFAPIVPAHDKFKTAVVVAAATAEQGCDAFGCVAAKVTSINTEKGYVAYVTTGGERGFANLSVAKQPLAVGQEVKLVTYMRRGKDGNKRLHVGAVYAG